jgi:hypothetical protein
MNVFHPFLSKRRSFEHEHELRALIWDEDRFRGVSGNWPVPASNKGMMASVDLDVLVEEIRVLPGSPIELLEFIRWTCNKYHLVKDVKQSRLDDRALY